MKEKIRKHFQALRQNLAPVLRDTYSHQAVQHLLSSPIWSQSETIMAYLALPQELSLDALYPAAWQSAKTMVIPISQPADHQLLLSRLDSFDLLSTGAYHIRELAPAWRKSIACTKIDLCLVPGVAFDLYGNRLGFGAGYYDRFLPRLRKDSIKIGVCLSVQLSSKQLPIDAYDIPMDYLLTEQGLIPPPLQNR